MSHNILETQNRLAIHAMGNATNRVCYTASKQFAIFMLDV